MIRVQRLQTPFNFAETPTSRRGLLLQAAAVLALGEPAFQDDTAVGPAALVVGDGDVDGFFYPGSGVLVEGVAEFFGNQRGEEGDVPFVEAKDPAGVGAEGGGICTIIAILNSIIAILVFIFGT